MSDTALADAVQELYAAPREEFIALRKELAGRARAAGDVAAATEIAKLTKPSTAAWVANQLARTDAAEVGALAGLGDDLREAHEKLDGARIRELSQERTGLIRDLLERAQQRHGNGLSESVLRELEEVLTRAVADADAGQALVSGCLTSAKGFAPTAGWPVGAPAGPPAPRAKPEPKQTSKKKPDDALDRARLALEEARAGVKEAEAARADDERALADADAAAQEAAAEVHRLGEELDAAETRERRARGLVATARRAAKESERQAGAAWRQVQQAEQRLAELEEK
ncbi:MAG TPA: hypothetical protein VFV67_08000 [Actinophytocola sp.]|uniref:hypothetical protein n=1 Tax=Actinophytocola sp. TaxID=1872138 RepID=UPI002DC0384C|nr:hypothetical protein [Actinophytocola sp.]HEU5470580.1 hypothetical protein [Actinophytocola sp.]